MEAVADMVDTPGKDKLWEWFGLSYASFLVLPRVLMHEMPDDWQLRMTELLNEWYEHVRLATDDLSDFTVFKRDRKGRVAAVPDWMKNYRRPDKAVIDNIMIRNNV